MILQQITYQASGSETDVSSALDKAIHAVQCADAHAARALSRTLYQMLADPKVRVAAPPFRITATTADQGAINATLTKDADAVQEEIPCITTEGATGNIAGADLMLLSLDALLEIDGEHAQMARDMAAIVDTGVCGDDFIAAVARLDALVNGIGRGDADDTPLSQALTQLKALQDERDATKAALQQAAEQATLLTDYREQVEACRTERERLEQLLCASVVRHYDQCAVRLDLLEQEIETIRTRSCLDSEDAAAIQRTETQVQTAQLQVDKTREEMRLVAEELEALQDSAAHADTLPENDPETLEQLQQQIRSSQGRITEFNARLDEVNSQITALDDQVAEAQEQLSSVPDFSRIAPNPIDWLNQLARSFKTALGVRDTEEEVRDTMREELADLRVEIAGDLAIFENSVNFAEELRAHQEKKRHWEERGEKITEKIRRDRSTRDELQDSMPGLFMLSFGCALFFSLLLGAYVGLQKTPILYPGALVLLSSLYFLAQLLVTRGRVARLTRSIAEGQAEFDLMNDEEKSTVSQVDRLMARADCATARELEARYDRYRELRDKLNALESRFKQQGEHLRESEERIPKLFERVRSTLEQVDEPPRNEDDVEGAVGRAIAKYQIYRETKRRLADLRNQHQGLLSRKRFLEKELADARENLPEAETRLREIMRANNFNAEADHRDINDALAAYYRYLDTVEESAGRRTVLTRTRKMLAERLPEEEAALETHARALDALLERVQFASPEQARAAAANTSALRDLETEKAAIEAEQEALLQGRPLETWRRLAGHVAVDDEDPGPAYYANEMETAEQQYEQMRKQYRACLQEREQMLAPHRPLHETEEDLAALENHVALLRQDVKAAAHASALMEECMHGRRTTYGDAIAEKAAKLMELFGAVALPHLNLDPAETPAVELIVDSEHQPAPAVVYLALRLAAAAALADDTAPFPLVIDAALQGAPLPVTPEQFVDALCACATHRQIVLVFESDDIAHALAARNVATLALT